MPQDVIASPDRATDAENARGAEGESARAGKPTDVRVIKQNLRDALEQLDNARQREDTWKSTIEELRSEIDGLKRVHEPKTKIEDYSEGEILQYALNPDIGETERTKAIVSLFDRRVKSAIDSLDETIDKRISNRQREAERKKVLSSEFGSLVSMLGEENLERGSALHDDAANYYKGLCQYIIDDDGKVSPESMQDVLRLLAVSMTGQKHARLGHNRGAEGGPPPPEDRLSGAGEATPAGASKARRDELIEQKRFAEAVALDVGEWAEGIGR